MTLPPNEPKGDAASLFDAPGGKVAGDPAIRMALHEHLGGLTDALVVDELSLCGTARVDVATIGETMDGFEIKSDRDTLRRLPGQVATYSSVLDSVTLVTTERHLRHAQSAIPGWWGITVASGTAQIDLVHLRQREPNPAIDPRALVTLLWRSEALGALSDRGMATGYRSKSSRVLWDRLVSGVSTDELRHIVRHALRSRINWR